MKRCIALVVSLFIVLSAASCAAANEPAPPEGDKTPDPAKIIRLDASVPEEVPAELAAKLLASCSVSGKNTLLSPLSICLALGMTANGASAETLEEFESLLGAPLEELNAYYRDIMSAAVSDDESCRVHIANSVWYDSGLNLKPLDSFLDTVKTVYYAQAEDIDFSSPDSPGKINRWVFENTDGMIENIIDRIDGDSLMFLINALFFDAKWAKAYQEYNVSKGDFKRADGSTSKVEYMSGSEYTYYETDEAVGFKKPYAGGKYSFVAFLPVGDIESFVSNLNGEKISALLGSAQRTEVRTRLPKFSYAYELELSETLKAIGLEKPFNPAEADFSSMFAFPENSVNAYIKAVKHKTFIELSEGGTRAAAVTSVEMGVTSMPIPTEYKEVYLESPFVYMIIENSTNTPLFIGTVNDPSQ